MEALLGPGNGVEKIMLSALNEEPPWYYDDEVAN